MDLPRIFTHLAMAVSISVDIGAVTYPDCDGQLLSDNPKQFRCIVMIKENIEILFADDPNVYPMVSLLGDL